MAAGQSSPRLDYTSTTALALSGGTIQDASGTNAVLTLPATGSDGLYNQDIVIANPVASGESLTTNENTATIGTVTGSDSIPLTYAIVSGPTNGTVTNFNASTGTFTYTPDLGYTGPDSFSFTATDSLSTSPAATVSISVTVPPPTITSSTTGMLENTPTMTIKGTGFDHCRQ